MSTQARTQLSLVVAEVTGQLLAVGCKGMTESGSHLIHAGQVSYPLHISFAENASIHHTAEHIQVGQSLLHLENLGYISVIGYCSYSVHGHAFKKRQKGAVWGPFECNFVHSLVCMELKIFHVIFFKLHSHGKQIRTFTFHFMHYY